MKADANLVRRIRMAADRGYAVARASKYAKMLGGTGSETTAAELLALALGEAPKKEDAPVEEASATELEEASATELEEASATELEEEEAPQEARDIASMTKDELYKVAQELDVSGRTKMDKDELIAAIEKASK